MEVVVASLKRGLKVKNEPYTNNVLLILIRHLEKGGEAIASTLAVAGTTGLLEQLFEIFQDSESICMNALIILNLVISLSSSTSVSSSNPLPISKRLLCHSKSFSGILSAITCHSSNISVVSQGIQLILFLSSDEVLLRKILHHQEQHIQKSSTVLNGTCVSDMLTNVMHTYSSNGSLMESVCHILYNLTYDDEEEDGVCRSYLAMLGMCKLLVDLLHNSDKIGSVSSHHADNDAEKAISSGQFKEQSGLVALPFQYHPTFPSNRLKAEIEPYSPAPNSSSSSTDSKNHNDNSSKRNIDLNQAIAQAIDDEKHDDYIEKQLEERLKDAAGMLPAQTPNLKMPNSVTNTPTNIHSESHYLEIGLGKWCLRAIGALCRHHAENQEAFSQLHACELIMHLRAAQLSLEESTGIGEDEANFAESFCWAVGNLADPGAGFSDNQTRLIELGVCESVLACLQGPFSQAQSGSINVLNRVYLFMFACTYTCRRDSAVDYNLKGRILVIFG